MYAPSSYANNFNTEISSDDVENLESYKKDDIISVNVAKVGSKYEVINVLDYELLSSVDLNKYSYQSYVVSNDNTVYYAATGMKTNNSGAMDAITDYSTTSSALDNTYNLYIDQYGFLIGNKVVDEKDNYLFLTGYDLIGSNLANKTATANVIFLEDGSMKTIDVNVSDTNKNIHNFKGTDKPADFYAELSGENTTHGAQGDSEYNKWFTYTEDDGVYTLSPVSRWIDVPYYGYNGFDDNNNPIPVPAKINCYDFRASIKNPGYSSVGGEIGNNKTVAVWGNDKSKFITVDAEDVSETTTRGISKIVNIYSGLDDVNITLDSGLYCDGIGYNDLYGKVLEPGKENVPSDYISSSKVVKSASSPAKYIDNPSMFVLYDKDNYVIGAIILGSDIGSKDNYGYILERVGSEYKENDKTYWQFNAVVNGEIKTLTAKTNASGVITGNSHFNDALIFDHTPTGTSGFVKFTYDNDGYVIGVTHVSKEANTSKLYDNGDYRSVVDPDVYSLYDLEWKLSTDPNQELRDGSAFTIKGRTLWGGINDAGIRHNADAPVVLLYQQEYTGTSGARTVHKVFDSLEDAKDFMVTNKMLVNNVFNGYVSAVLADNGYAEWIVIKCLDPYVITNDNGQGSGSAKTYVNKIGRDKSNNTFNITVRTNNSKLVNAITNNNTQAEVRITNLNGSQVTYEPSYPITKGAPVLVKGTNDLYEFIVSVPFKSDTEVTDELQISVAITDTTNNEAYLVEGGQFVPG